MAASSGPTGPMRSGRSNCEVSVSGWTAAPQSRKPPGRYAEYLWPPSEKTHAQDRFNSAHSALKLRM